MLKETIKDLSDRRRAENFSAEDGVLFFGGREGGKGQ